MKKYKIYAEEELIDLVKSNKDTNAFGEIYNRYSLKIYNKTLSIVNSKDIAKDLTHDIFLKIFLSLKTFKKTAKFSTWVYSITYNYCIDYLRKNNKYKQIDIDHIIIDPTANENNESRELFNIKVKQLKYILTQISHEERILLFMKYQDQMSIHEIMKVLSLKESAVKMRINRAKTNVIKLYNQKYK